MSRNYREDYGKIHPLLRVIKGQGTDLNQNAQLPMLGKRKSDDSAGGPQLDWKSSTKCIAKARQTRSLVDHLRARAMEYEDVKGMYREIWNDMSAQGQGLVVSDTEDVHEDMTDTEVRQIMAKAAEVRAAAESLHNITRMHHAILCLEKDAVESSETALRHDDDEPLWRPMLEAVRTFCSQEVFSSAITCDGEQLYDIKRGYTNAADALLRLAGRDAHDDEHLHARVQARIDCARAGPSTDEH